MEKEIQFKNPPIQRRVVNLTLKIDAEAYRLHALQFLKIVSESLELSEKKKKQCWNLEIKPSQSPPKPKVSLTEIPTYYSEKEGNTSYSVEFAPPENGHSNLTIIQFRPDDKITYFKNLRSQIEVLLGEMKKFPKLNKVTGVNLVYVNEISNKYFPSFESSKSLQIGKILTFFKNLGLKSEYSICAPLDIRVPHKLNEAPNLGNYSFSFKTRGKAEKNILFLELQCFQTLSKVSGDIEYTLEKLDFCHALILNSFEDHLTPVAIKELCQH